ncbi:acetolactate synthase 2 small subunit [Endozoicomonas sp. OPT23]|nr:acetolactate synthase 2 small subunit [Endozoicomonas sp. OPT23]
MNTAISTYSLDIHCYKKPEVVERLLRVVRHRGFSLDQFSMSSSHCGNHLQACLQVSSHRPVELLTAQLNKLYDVIEVQKPQVTSVSVKAGLWS